MKLVFRSLLLVGIIVSIAACKKTEGYGGKSTLYGKVLDRDYNNAGQFQDEYYKPEVRVYIVFGDDDFYSDEIRTDFEGKFKFSFLYAGNYTVYTYSECSPIDPCDSGVRKVELKVTILKNGDTIVTDDLVIENW